MKKLSALALLFAFCACLPGEAFAADGGRPSILGALWKWAPLLLSGFAFNLLISVLAMALGTVLGAVLGLGLVAPSSGLRRTSHAATQFFRNAPWLVLLFFCMYLMPFEFVVGGAVVPFPGWVKAVIGFALPVMANTAEIVRGAVQSIPPAQWEAAESLSFTRRQTLWMVILPQCVKRMLPSWMNLYSLVTMATSLASVVGVSEMLTLTADALAAEGGRTDLMAPFYGFVLFCFFVYCYPIGVWTRRLEARYAVK